MTLAIRELERRGGLGREDVDAFLAAHAFPLVEGSSATFVWRGEAESVHLQHWVFGLPSAQPFTRLGETDLWYFIQELPPRSRVEYKLEIVPRGETRSRLVLDPLNPHLANDPFGANSVCHGASYQRPEWTLPEDEARRGTLETLEVASEGSAGRFRSTSTCRPAFAPAGAIHSSSPTTAATICATRRCARCSTT